MADKREEQLERMRQAGAEQVAFMVKEHLGLVDQPPEGRGMDDAVAIALVFGSRGRRWLRMTPSTRQRRVAGVTGKRHSSSRRFRLSGSTAR